MEPEIRDALARVLSSEGFARSERLQAFLTYVVEEAIAGRGDAIRGKRIAIDVFGRDPADGADPENVVRVEARRLRQALGAHYAAEGAGDPLRIHVDSGGYCPRFEAVEAAFDSTPPRRGYAIALPALTFLVGTGIGAACSLLVRDEPAPPPASASADAGPDARKALIRVAVLEKSPVSLQALNLAEQARGMIFPIFDRERQVLISEIFRRVIELDPDYFGGYAGAAQTLATLALISLDGPERAAFVHSAGEMMRAAVRLAPAEAWTQSALAWTALAERDYERALNLSRRAAKMAPDDGHVLDFHGAISLFSGAFDEAVAAANRARLQGGSNQRFANRNIFGAASFHLGNLRQSFDAFEAAAEYGDPLSAPSLAYQAAALHALGERGAALDKLAELRRAWPDARLDEMLYGMYGDPAHADQVLRRLVDLGWRHASGNPAPPG